AGRPVRDGGGAAMSSMVLSPARFPHLGLATDGDAMGSRLQRALLEGSGLVVEACAAPKVHVAGDECRVQYGLSVVDPARVRRQMLALGAMFGDTAAAARALPG